MDAQIGQSRKDELTTSRTNFWRCFPHSTILKLLGRCSDCSISAKKKARRFPDSEPSFTQTQAAGRWSSVITLPRRTPSLRWPCNLYRSLLRESFTRSRRFLTTGPADPSRDRSVCVKGQRHDDRARKPSGASRRRKGPDVSGIRVLTLRPLPARSISAQSRRTRSGHDRSSNPSPKVATSKPSLRNAQPQPVCLNRKTCLFPVFASAQPQVAAGDMQYLNVCLRPALPLVSIPYGHVIACAHKRQFPAHHRTLDYFFGYYYSALCVPTQAKDHSVIRFVELLLVFAGYQSHLPLSDHFPIIVFGIQTGDSISSDAADQRFVRTSFEDFVAKVRTYKYPILVV